MGHAPPRMTHKPQTNEQWLRSLYVSGRIAVDEFEARVAYHLQMGSLNTTAPVPIMPAGNVIGPFGVADRRHGSRSRMEGSRC